MIISVKFHKAKMIYYDYVIAVLCVATLVSAGDTMMRQAEVEPHNHPEAGKPASHPDFMSKATRRGKCVFPGQCDVPYCSVA